MSKKTDIAILEEALGDKELVLFFLTWLKHNRNATKAYKELHPNVSEKVASVLGSRLLAKVSIDVILDSYGIGKDTYFKKLKDGLEANKIRIEIVGKDKKGRNKYTRITEPDHSVQERYHSKLGELLGLQGPVAQTNVAVQVNNLISEKKNKYGI